MTISKTHSSFKELRISDLKLTNLSEEETPKVTLVHVCSDKEQVIESFGFCEDSKEIQERASSEIQFRRMQGLNYAAMAKAESLAQSLQINDLTGIQTNVAQQK